MFAWLAVLRLVVLLNAVGLNIYRAGNFTRPVAGAVCVVVMVVWTGVVIWAYADDRRRTWMLLGADLAVSVALLALSPVVKGPGFNATVPGFWVMGVLLAWAIHYGWVGGLLASLVLTTADVTARQEVTQTNYANVFLLVLGGTIVGLLSESLQRMAAERDAAERAAAAAAERARLARAVHDGVLQVLALVQRRGGELGGDGPEIARLAGEQEAALRALIRQQDSVTARAAETAREVDLASALEAVGAGRGLRVEVATPGTPVLLAADVGRELVAAVGAALDNVAAHVGEEARAWVLVEDLPGEVVVSVRDEGPGILEGRLAEAEGSGRLGVSESIRGRLRDLGGSAELFTGPGQGVEWELRLPR